MFPQFSAFSSGLHFRKVATEIPKSTAVTRKSKMLPPLSMAPESEVNPSKKVDTPTACVEFAAIEDLPSKVCLAYLNNDNFVSEKIPTAWAQKNTGTPRFVKASTKSRKFFRER